MPPRQLICTVRTGAVIGWCRLDSGFADGLGALATRARARAVTTRRLAEELKAEVQAAEIELKAMAGIQRQCILSYSPH